MENIRLIDRSFVDTLIRKRRSDMHKGDCGRVLVIAGSHGMAGAAVLCAKGALRGGAGLVRVSVSEELIPILQTAVPEATCVSRNLTADMLKEYQAIVIGPGLGSDAGNSALIKTVLKSACPLIVMDADALNTVVRENLFDSLRTASGRLIITPHPGEAARLLSCKSEDIAKDRPAAAMRLTEKIGAVVVLKGQGTVVADPDGELRINTTGNPGMATGGSGDVLAGIIGAFAAQGLCRFDAAAAGVYVHGMAGDLAADIFGEYGMTSGDLPKMTAYALKKIVDEQKQS